MKKSAPFLLVFLLFFSCKPSEREKDALFSLLPPSSTRVDFINELTESEEFNIIEYLYFNNGGGVAAGDINNDGLTDLYFTSNQESNRLYLNRGNLKFEEITEKAGVAGKGDWSTGVTMADVNGDGFLDIYVCQVGNYKNLQGKNQLFINQGDLTFKEEAHEYGLDFQGFSTQAAFFDYDLDGDLDMYLLNHSVHSSRSYGSSELRFAHDERAGDRLYRNDEAEGGRFFQDITQQSGIYSSQIGYGLGINICDINNDGFPDIYVSNDFHENDYLYINQGKGIFRERLTELLAHTSRSSMGNDVGDINNDGLLDVLVLDMFPDQQQIQKQSGGEDDYELSEIKRDFGYYYQFVRNTLQLNLGGEMFSEIGRLAGIYATDWSWSPLICDLDNDGWKDLFITNGIYRRANDLDYVKYLSVVNRDFSLRDNSGVTDKGLYEKMPLYPNINFLFKNNGNLTFSNRAMKWGFNTRSYSNGSAYADLDNDGDLELIVNNINGPAFIYRNNSETRLNNHYLSVELKGKGLNTGAVGARVTIYCDGRQLLAEHYATRGFMSASFHRLHFGLGSVKEIDSLVVRWPDRSEKRINSLQVDQVVSLEMERAREPFMGIEKQTERQKLFSPFRIPGLEYMHHENAYADLKRERLIPHNLSAEGPAQAVGDVNGDGLDDLFVGGAAGQEAMLLIQLNDGGFKPLPVPLFRQERHTEDVDAALFDADGDGNLDLYIVRGGNEVPAGNPLLDDRLLLNDGKGGFNLSGKASIPHMAQNGSCVRPVDFDGDGDLDLFVGARSVPGAYGISPDQFLLENNGNGVFKDCSDYRSKGLKNVGMVTDARWMDYDQDGDPDLVVVGEWMKVCIFSNEGGFLTDITRRVGLEETSGWWNCIRVDDIDRDGDLDLVGGNLGWNTILKASKQEPVEMYVYDFDNNGSLEQVICAYHDGTSYPVASLDQMAAQISGLKKKYPNYSDFGGKTAQDIFGKEKLDQSVQKSAVLFESCIFLNNGKRKFEIQKLPVHAQFSPVRDILMHDFNADGIKDLVLVGNNYSVRPSYGRYDASYGWCFIGEEGPGYKALMPVESGLRINGDARKVQLIKISGKQYLVALVNDGPLQVFQF